MSDVTMCSGQHCKAKDQCYRYRAEPTSSRQSYFAYPPGHDVDCSYFYGLNSNLRIVNIDMIELRLKAEGKI